MAGKKKPLTQKAVAAGASLAKEGHMAETGDNTAAAAEDSVAAQDSVLAVEDPVVLTEDIVPAGEEPGAVRVEEIQAETGTQSMASSFEESMAGPAIEPGAAIVEAAVTEDFEVLAEIGKEGLKAAESIVSSFSGGFQIFATEAADYSKNCFESRAAFAGALLGAKSLETAVQLQAGYTKSAYARFLAHLMKMSGLYLKLLGEAGKPIDKVISNTDRAKA
jgi:hypothetical protein